VLLISHSYSLQHVIDSVGGEEKSRLFLIVAIFWPFWHLTGNSEGLHFYEGNVHLVGFYLDTRIECSYLDSMGLGRKFELMWNQNHGEACYYYCFLFYFYFVKSEEFRGHRETPYYCHLSWNQRSSAGKPSLTTFHRKINTSIGISLHLSDRTLWFTDTS
jgi:hypothetical protein